MFSKNNKAMDLQIFLGDKFKEVGGQGFHSYIFLLIE